MQILLPNAPFRLRFADDTHSTSLLAILLFGIVLVLDKHNLYKGLLRYSGDEAPKDLRTETGVESELRGKLRPRHETCLFPVGLYSLHHGVGPAPNGVGPS